MGAKPSRSAKESNEKKGVIVRAPDEENPDVNDPFYIMPKDVVFLILRRLARTDLLRIASVNRRWRVACYDPYILNTFETIISHPERITDDIFLGFAFRQDLSEKWNLARCKKLTDISIKYLVTYPKKITSLDLTACNGLTDHSLEILGASPKVINHLESIKVDWWTSVSTSAIKNFFSKCKVLKEISIFSRETRSDFSMDAYALPLTITTLKFGDSFYPHCLKPTCFTQFPQLAHLSVTANMTESLSQPERLFPASLISFEYNPTSEREWKWTKKLMKECPNLKHLILKAHTIPANEFSYLEAMAPQLLTLGLHDCSVNQIYLIKVLQKCNSLRSLDLSGHRMRNRTLFRDHKEELGQWMPNLTNISLRQWPFECIDEVQFIWNQVKVEW